MYHDYSAANIQIGGTLPTEFLEQLTESIAIDHCMVGNNDTECADEDNILRLLSETLDGKNPLYLSSPEAYRGAFSFVETTCQALNLTFVRRSESIGEYNPILVWWTPGMAEPFLCLATQDGEEVIAVVEIREAMLQGNLGQLLAERTAPQVPPLILKDN